MYLVHVLTCPGHGIELSTCKSNSGGPQIAKVQVSCGVDSCLLDSIRYRSQMKMLQSTDANLVAIVKRRRLTMFALHRIYNGSVLFEEATHGRPTTISC